MRIGGGSPVWCDIEVSTLSPDPLKMRIPHAVGACALALTLLACAQTTPVVHYLNGTNATPHAFQFSDPDIWRQTPEGYLELHGKSSYKPKVRSPFCIALLDGHTHGDFVLELEANQTGRDVPHRDLCFFFGVENAQRYYYVHIAKSADPKAHNIFRVEDKPRTNIAETTTEGIDWGQDAWRKIKIERELASGAIRVYFEDMDTPIMTATDKTFGRGMIGIGSFDDTGRFRNIRLTSPAIQDGSPKIF